MGNDWRQTTHRQIFVFFLSWGVLNTAVARGQAPPIAVGKSNSGANSEPSVVGSNGPEAVVVPGTARFEALVEERDPTIEFAEDSSRLMTFETRERLRELARLAAVPPATPTPGPVPKLKVMRAWLDRDAAAVDDNLFSHYEGRGLDVTLVVADDASLQLLAGKAVDARFDWVQNKAEVVGGRPAHIHVSSKSPEAPTLAVESAAIVPFAQVGTEADAYLKNISDFRDTASVDTFIRSYPDTTAANAAHAIRYAAMLQQGEPFVSMASGQGPDMPQEKRDALRKVVREYNRFIFMHPDTLGSRVALSQLILFYRLLDDPAGYLEFLQNYPATPESYLALTLLQQVEFRRLVKNSTQDLSSTLVAFSETDNSINSIDIESINYEEMNFIAGQQIEITSAINKGVFTVLDVSPSKLRLEGSKGRDAASGVLVSIKNLATMPLYDDYLLHFPQAPQWETVAELATLIALERENRDFVLPSQGDFEKLQRRAASLLGEAVGSYQSLRVIMAASDPTATTATVSATKAYAPEQLGAARFHLEKIRRQERLLSACYSGSNAHKKLFQLQLQWEANGKLDRLSLQIEDLRREVAGKQQELIDAVRSEFDETRKALTSNVDRLSSEIQGLGETVKKEVANLRDDLDIRLNETNRALVLIRQDLGSIHSELKLTVRGLEEVEVAVGRVTAAVATTDNRIDSIIDYQKQANATLMKIDKAVGTGMSNVASQVKSLASSNAELGIDVTDFIPSGIIRYVENRASTLYHAIPAELSRLSMHSVEETVMDPRGVIRKAIDRGDASFKAELARARDTFQKEVLARLFGVLGRDKLIQEPQFIECGRIFSGDPVYFVNGIWTSSGTAKDYGEALANLLQLPVRVIYNPTFLEAPYRTGDAGSSYGPDDLMECVYDRAWPLILSDIPRLAILAMRGYIQENPASRMMGHVIFHADGPVRIVGHSQGSMIVRNAMVGAWVLGKDVNSVKYVLVGCPLGDDELLVGTGASQVKIKNHPGDLVAQTLGFRGHIDKIKMDKHNFIDIYIGEFGDVIKNHFTSH